MKTIVDATTGNIIELEPTAEETELDAANKVAAAIANAEREAAEVAAAAVKTSARAKLAVLGLTEEEIAALVGI
jgi:hypothetical protein